MHNYQLQNKFILQAAVAGTFKMKTWWDKVVTAFPAFASGVIMDFLERRAWGEEGGFAEAVLVYVSLGAPALPDSAVWAGLFSPWCKGNFWIAVERHEKVRSSIRMRLVLSPITQRGWIRTERALRPVFVAHFEPVMNISQQKGGASLNVYKWCNTKWALRGVINFVHGFVTNAAKNS